jgi:predicted ester cyclase
MSTDTNKKIVQRFVTEYQTGNDQQVLRDTIADTLVNHTPMSPDAAGGIEEVKGIFDMFHAAFEGFTAEIVDQLAEGDKVMTYKTFSGTHTGEFMGIPPTGKHVRFDVMDIIRLADGRFVEHWGLIDQAGLLGQLGAL